VTIWTTLTTSAFYFGAAAVTHLLVCTFTGESRFMLKGLLTGFAFLFAAAASEYAAGAPDLVSLYLLLTLWLAYLMFFVNLLNSVTLKMLARLAEQPGGTLDEAGFGPVFDEGAAIGLRLEDMRANGFLTLEAGSVSLTKKAGLLLKIVFLIRKVLSIDIVG